MATDIFGPHGANRRKLAVSESDKLVRLRDQAGNLREEEVATER